ncbi:conserved hypothetical protein [Candidatus Nitrotoga sp. BS]|uniref:hypothetical protein n=1 Tax=Candidatus Nitrotoga sp. BS TaxID=2890408 RepID=UPI001EF36C08|nr:hypothetical protein [Candidatus Nitrotoga sp. BS]CAH1200042.1 conserved hypothetical protein [Candidatus Nitrotoga sp. BS]
MSTDSRRLAVALLFSLLFHILLLSLTFGGKEFGLPGFGIHWQERRIAAPDLYVVLKPAQVAVAKSANTPVKAPLQQASNEQAVAGKPAPTQPPFPAVIAIERADEATWVVPPPILGLKPAADAPGASIPGTVMPEPPDASEVAQYQAAPEVRKRADKVNNFVPPEREAQRQVNQEVAQHQEIARQEAARIEAARLEAERVETARLTAAKLEAQRQEIVRQEAARIKAARLEAERLEAVRLTAAKLEAQRQEIARQEAARTEAARLEAERLETARLSAAKQEAQRQEIARQEAARFEAARLEAERLGALRRAAAKLEAQRQEAARQEIVHIEAARLEAERLEAARQAARVSAEQEEAKREARLRAIGRQLNENAARRKAASTAARSPSTLPYSFSTERRARLWGRADSNAALVKYAEAWARKIQFNTPVDTVREVAKRPHTNPMVTVSIRSDGSVEPVIFVISSGVAEVDEAIRRIVQSHEHYQAFPPELAREFDVIEIRRTWHFDTAIRLD